MIRFFSVINAGRRWPCFGTGVTNNVLGVPLGVYVTQDIYRLHVLVFTGDMKCKVHLVIISKQTFPKDLLIQGNLTT